MNDWILKFCKDAGLDGKAGWQLFKEKEYLGKLDNQPEVGKALEQFILRFEREPKNDPELSRFHKFDSKGKVTGVRDMEIVDYIVENVSFFVRGEIPYYYEHGVFIEDAKGVKLKYRIQKLIYRDQVNSSMIQRVYNLLITQPQIYRNSYELNKQPAHWINFKNAYYDVLSGELIEHDPKYLTINQGIVLSRDNLMEKIWSSDYEGESRTLDVHIKTLRQKLGKAGSYIKTVRNVGYFLDLDTDV